MNDKSQPLHQQPTVPRAAATGREGYARHIIATWNGCRRMGLASQRRRSLTILSHEPQEGPAQARSSRYLWHRWALTPAVLRLAWCDNFSDFVDPTEPARSFFVSKFFSLSANSVSKIKVSANFVSKFLLSANQIVVSKFCKQISKFDCRKQIVSAIQQIAP